MKSARLCLLTAVIVNSLATTSQAAPGPAVTRAKYFYTLQRRSVTPRAH